MPEGDSCTLSVLLVERFTVTIAPGLIETPAPPTPDSEDDTAGDGETPDSEGDADGDEGSPDID